MFDSKAEARRYQQLKLLVKAGEIERLEVHRVWPLWAFRATGEKALIGRYVCDFAYEYPDGEVVVEDVKSRPTRTALYRLKRKLFEANYGVDITEVLR